MSVWTKVVAVRARGDKAAVVWKEVVTIWTRDWGNQIGRRRVHRRRIRVGRAVANAVASGVAMKAGPTKVAHQLDVGRCHYLRRGQNREGLDVERKYRTKHAVGEFVLRAVIETMMAMTTLFP